VDSHARQAAIDGLESASAALFATAQKQIYNLMKFDSFSRCVHRAAREVLFYNFLP
jgi:hypothetical protein